MSPPGRQSQSSSQGEVVFGIVILVIGVILLLDRTGVVGLGVSWRVWPFAVLAMGLAGLTEPGGYRSKGIWLLALGVWGLVSEFALFGFDYQSSWPLIVIGAGVSLVWHSVEGRCGTSTGDQRFPT